MAPEAIRKLALDALHLYAKPDCMGVNSSVDFTEEYKEIRISEEAKGDAQNEKIYPESERVSN